MIELTTEEEKVIQYHRAMKRYQRLVNVIHDVGVARVASIDETMQLMIDAKLVRVIKTDDEGYTLQGTCTGGVIMGQWWQISLELAKIFKKTDNPQPCNQKKEWCIAQRCGFFYTCSRGELEHKATNRCAACKWVECAASEVGKGDICVRQTYGIYCRCDWDLHSHAFIVWSNKKNAINPCIQSDSMIARQCFVRQFRHERMRLQDDKQINEILGRVCNPNVDDDIDGIILSDEKQPPLLRACRKIRNSTMYGIMLKGCRYSIGAVCVPV
jgi:hypothetical protein